MTHEHLDQGKTGDPGSTEETLLLQGNARRQIARLSYELSESDENFLTTEEVKNVFTKISFAYFFIIFGHTEKGKDKEMSDLMEKGALEFIEGAGAFVKLRYSDFGDYVSELGECIAKSQVVDESILDVEFDIEPGEISEADSKELKAAFAVFGQARARANNLNMSNISLFEMIDRGFLGEYRLNPQRICSWLLDHQIDIHPDTV